MSNDERMDGDRDQDDLNEANAAFSDENRDYQAEPDTVETADEGSGERDIESVNAGGRGKNHLIPLLIFGPLVLIAVYIMTSGDDDEQENVTPPRDQPTISNTSQTPSIPSPPPLPDEPANEPEPEPEPENTVQTGSLAPPQPRQRANGEDVVTPGQRRRQGEMLAANNNSGNNNSGSSLEPVDPPDPERGQGQGVGLGGQQNSQLGELTTPERLEGQQARVIANRDMTLTQGTVIPCSLETAIDSTLPGFVSCRITRDIYGASGRVPLIDRGSKFVGQYQNGLEIGDGRIFVLWNRIETPEGVVINVDSPGTDQLGRAGHDGHVDSRFWDRFGAAFIFSMFEDVGDYLSNQARRSNTENTINLGNTASTTSDSGEMILERYMDIPPRLTKNQGGRINIFVARDLDFSGVYDLAIH